MIIHFLRCMYHAELPLSEDTSFYETVMQDIEYFSLAPQIYHLLRSNGQLEQVPHFLQTYLRTRSDVALYQNIFIKNQMNKLFEQFEKASIPIIPLKGVDFAEQYFGHIGARYTSDIDLLVKENQFKQASQIVKSLGFTFEEEPIPSHFHHSFSKPLPHSPYPLTVELHWDLLKENTSNLLIEEFWETATPYENLSFVKRLSTYHTFYMICLHGWKHHLNSLKYFLDIIQILEAKERDVDLDLLLSDAKRHQTSKRIIRTLSIIYHWFPELEEAKHLPFKKPSSLRWDYAAIRNSNVSTLNQYRNILQFELLDFDNYKHTLNALSRWLFPSRTEIGMELGTLSQSNPLFWEYIRLHFKRCSSLLKLMR